MISNDSTTHISGQLVGKKRSRAITKTNSENEQFDDLSEVTSVVVTDLHPAVNSLTCLKYGIHDRFFFWVQTS